MTYSCLSVERAPVSAVGAAAKTARLFGITVPLPIQKTNGCLTSHPRVLPALGTRLRVLKAQILESDRMINAWHRCDQMSKPLDESPSIGPALVASVADPKVFRSGRGFSARARISPTEPRRTAMTGMPHDMAAIITSPKEPGKATGKSQEAASSGTSCPNRTSSLVRQETIRSVLPIESRRHGSTSARYAILAGAPRQFARGHCIHLNLDQYCQRGLANGSLSGDRAEAVGLRASREHQGRHGNADDYLSHRSPCFVDWR